MPQDQLQSVLDAAFDAVVLMDHAGRIRFANHAMARLFGWEPGELPGRDFGTLLAASQDDAWSRLMPVATNLSQPVLARHRDGSSFPARISLRQVAGAEPAQYAGFIQHFPAASPAAEDALRLSQRLMQVSRLATMGEMAAGIAHEVNQPLTAINNYALAAERFLVLAEPELGEAREALREIVAESHRAAEIIRRLRRIVRGNEEHRETVAVAELIEDVRVLCAADARAADTRLRFELQPDLPRLRVHRTQIAQVLLNLVRNALDAVAADPAAGREVVVQCRRNAEGDCELAVCDNGPGVAPQIRPHLFQPFRSTRPNGAGLGLPMSQTIAQAHGGSLRHEPATPRGARFILTLPAVQAS